MSAQNRSSIHDLGWPGYVYEAPSTSPRGWTGRVCTCSGFWPRHYVGLGLRARSTILMLVRRHRAWQGAGVRGWGLCQGLPCTPAVGPGPSRACRRTGVQKAPAVRQARRWRPPAARRWRWRRRGCAGSRGCWGSWTGGRGRARWRCRRCCCWRASRSCGGAGPPA